MTYTRIFDQGDTMPEGGLEYRKHATVMMLCMSEPFLCVSREGELQGQPGDFLVEDGHGGFYPVSAEFHAKNYVAVDTVGER